MRRPTQPGATLADSQFAAATATRAASIAAVADAVAALDADPARDLGSREAFQEWMQGRSDEILRAFDGVHFYSVKENQAELKGAFQKGSFEHIQKAASEAGILQQPVTPAADDPVAKLKKAKEMLDLGLITQQDYDALKTKALGL